MKLLVEHREMQGVEYNGVMRLNGICEVIGVCEVVWGLLNCMGFVRLYEVVWGL